ncbi:MAG: hypothetical protein WCR55_12110 [Lentisphaerota bacterium]
MDYNSTSLTGKSLEPTHKKGKHFISGEGNFFTIVNEDSAQRSFTNSGICDVKLNKASTAITINHYSTKIILSGLNLSSLYNNLLSFNVSHIYLGFIEENGKGQVYTVTNVMYMDEVENSKKAFSWTE